MLLAEVACNTNSSLWWDWGSFNYWKIGKGNVVEVMMLGDALRPFENEVVTGSQTAKMVIATVTVTLTEIIFDGATPPTPPS